jgi:hypothetical protein
MIPALLLGTLLSCSAVMAPLDPQFRNENTHLNSALSIARAAVSTERCQRALALSFPEYGTETDWEALFAEVSFVSTEIINERPTIAAYTSCDVSLDTVMMVQRWYMWLTRRQVAETMIHEFVHLLTCPAILMEFEHQSDMPQEGFEAGEQLAYTLAGICIGE